MIQLRYVTATCSATNGGLVIFCAVNWFDLSKRLKKEELPEMKCNGSSLGSKGASVLSQAAIGVDFRSDPSDLKSGFKSDSKVTFKATSKVVLKATSKVTSK